MEKEALEKLSNTEFDIYFAMLTEMKITRSQQESTPPSTSTLSTPESIIKESEPQANIRFSINGPIFKPQRNSTYYFLEPDQSRVLKDAMMDNEYSGFCGPRSAGKTTTAIEGRVIVDEPIDFWRNFILKIYDYLNPPFKPEDTDIFKMNWIEIKSLLKVGSKLFRNNKVHLVIDEFDALFSFKKEIITEILSEFRSWKTSALIAIKSITIVGTFAILELKTKSNVSPFNIKSNMFVQNFSEEEVTKIMEMNIKQKGVTISQSIIKDIYTLTNGHKGFVNIIGDLINIELMKNGIIEPKVWNNIINRELFSRLKRFKTIDRMIDSVIKAKNHNIKNNLRLALLSSDGIIPESKEGLYLSREGIYTPSHGDGYNNFIFSSNIVKQICLYLMDSIIPTEKILKLNGLLDMENILRIAVKFISPEILNMQLKKASKQPKTFSVKKRISSSISCKFEKTILSPNNNIIATNGRPDLVVTTGPLSESEKSIIIELVVTTTISDIQNHITKTNPYVENNDFNAREGWVLHFTMAKNDHDNYKYPSVPDKYPKIGILHVYHDADYDNLQIYCYPPKSINRTEVDT
ncbi:hypothetical protein ACTFIY_000578 [Dictyostelium cf. discoideum]